jgi:integrase
MENSMSHFFRTLRAVYNKAIKEGIVRIENYPFNTFKISEFSTETRKRALTRAEIKKIEGLDLEPGSNLYESRLYFVFSYYGQGINFNDIAKLKYENLKDNRIEYKRAKTGQIITFKLLPAAQEIIEYHSKVTGHDYANYIFPILNKNIHISAVQIDNRIHKVITKVNADLKEIGILAGIQIPITTYVARHTFANVLKKSGVATNIISEAMGHDNPETTQIYLDSFGNDEIDKAMEYL